MFNVKELHGCVMGSTRRINDFCELSTIKIRHHPEHPQGRYT